MTVLRFLCLVLLTMTMMTTTTVAFDSSSLVQTPEEQQQEQLEVDSEERTLEVGKNTGWYGDTDGSMDWYISCLVCVLLFFFLYPILLYVVLQGWKRQGKRIRQ